jgi:hypothetical protein
VQRLIVIVNVNADSENRGPKRKLMEGEEIIRDHVDGGLVVGWVVGSCVTELTEWCVSVGLEIEREGLR